MNSQLISLLGRKPDALLFDLDGTLVDSVPDLAAAIDGMLLQRGSPIVKNSFCNS